MTELPAGVRLCGAWADHVDHMAPRHAHPGSALTSAGSTRRWRRIRAYVLGRDGRRCQMWLDELTGDVVDAPRPATPPAGPDDVLWLRATCWQHNLRRSGHAGDSAPTKTANNKRQLHAGRWEW